MTKQRNIAAFVAYAMYLLTGAGCVVVGSSIPSLMKHFDKSLPAIAVLASAFAIGRVATVFPVGALTEKFGAKVSVTVGVIFFLIFLVGIPFTTSYVAAIIFAAIAGIGMSTQDSSCAVILREVFPNTYSSSLSAGQAFFSIGCFTPPLLMGVALQQNISFKIVYIILALIGVAMLFVIPFMKLSGLDYKEEEAESEGLLPIKLKHQKIGYLFLGIASFTYFGTTNTIHTYTAAFVESFGIAESVSVSVLTVYSVGCMIGSFAFISILRKIHETKVLWVNMVLALISLLAAMIFQTATVFFITYFLAGLFCGVLFSVLISIAVSLNPLHAGIAAATIGFVGGLADILSPLITGAIITVTSVRSTYYYCIAMCAACMIAAIGYRFMYKHRKK